MRPRALALVAAVFVACAAQRTTRPDEVTLTPSQTECAVRVVIERDDPWDLGGVEVLAVDDRILQQTNPAEAHPPPVEMRLDPGAHTLEFAGKYVGSHGYGFKLKTQCEFRCAAGKAMVIRVVPMKQDTSSAPFVKLDARCESRALGDH